MSLQNGIFETAIVNWPIYHCNQVITILGLLGMILRNLEIVPAAQTTSLIPLSTFRCKNVLNKSLTSALNTEGDLLPWHQFKIKALLVDDTISKSAKEVLGFFGLHDDVASSFCFLFSSQFVYKGKNVLSLNKKLGLISFFSQEGI